MIDKPNYKRAKDEAEILISKLEFSDPPISLSEIESTLNLTVHVITMPEKFREVAGFVDIEKKIYS